MNKIILTIICSLFLLSGCGLEDVRPSKRPIDIQLVEAVNKGDVKGVAGLLAKGADPEAKNINGDHVLSTAAFNGRMDVVRLLLEKGADLKASHNGALKSAAYGGRVEIVKFLLEKGADVNDAGFEGYTALMAAADDGNLDVMRMFLDRGADVNAAGLYGDTALIMAAEEGNTGAVVLLLEKGADVDAKAAETGTALIVAAEKGYTEIARALLANGADVKIKVPPNDATAMDIARATGHAEIMELLKKAGARE